MESIRLGSPFFGRICRRILSIKALVAENKLRSDQLLAFRPQTNVLLGEDVLDEIKTNYVIVTDSNHENRKVIQDLKSGKVKVYQLNNNFVPSAVGDNTGIIVKNLAEYADRRGNVVTKIYLDGVHRGISSELPRGLPPKLWR